mgnify:CR=1 FL=1
MSMLHSLTCSRTLCANLNFHFEYNWRRSEVTNYSLHSGAYSGRRDGYVAFPWGQALVVGGAANHAGPLLPYPFYLLGSVSSLCHQSIKHVIFSKSVCSHTFLNFGYSKFTCSGVIFIMKILVNNK